MKKILAITLFVNLVFMFLSLVCFQAQARSLNVHKSVTITGENQWSEAFSVPVGKTILCCIDTNSNTNLTVTLQVQFRDEYLVAPTTWNYDVDDWAVTPGLPDEVNILPAFSEWVRFRVGCKTGDYTSGNCTSRMSRGAR